MTSPLRSATSTACIGADEGRVIVSGSPADICDDAGLPSLSDVFVKITANGRDPRLEAKTLIGGIYA